MVLRAEQFYLPPPDADASAWDDLPISTRVLRHTELVAQRRLPEVGRDVLAEPLWARIDAGRWIAECGCRSAQIVSPSDPWMLCTLCLDGWHPLTFPDDVAAAEAVVAGAPARAQFWRHPDAPGPR